LEVKIYNLFTVNGPGSLWSSDYSEYDEYDLESSDPSKSSSSTGSEEKEIGSDLPPEIYCDLVKLFFVKLTFTVFSFFFN